MFVLGPNTGCLLEFVFPSTILKAHFIKTCISNILSSRLDKFLPILLSHVGSEFNIFFSCGVKAIETSLLKEAENTRDLLSKVKGELAKQEMDGEKSSSTSLK